MAVDLLADGLANRMVVLRTGIYTNVPITVVQGGAKRVDVDALYNAEEYRPKLHHMNGKPMFLY
jgi:6-phosphofructokinase 1